MPDRYVTRSADASQRYSKIVDFLLDISSSGNAQINNPQSTLRFDFGNYNLNTHISGEDRPPSYAQGSFYSCIHFLQERLTPTKFAELASKWKKDTSGVSSMSRKLSNESYQKILTFGWLAVPFIIEDLKKEAAPWFSALRLITGREDIGAEHRGNFRKIGDAWVQWYQQMGFDF